MRIKDEYEDRSAVSRGSGYVRATGYVIGILILAAAIIHFPSVDLGTLLNKTNSEPAATKEVRMAPDQAAPVNDTAKEKQIYRVTEIRRILSKTEAIWGKLFKEMGGQYAAPKLILFSDSTPTSCGRNKTAKGPFYCPGEQSIYLDLRHLEQMEQRMRTGKDFARAYIIAHEVGHHVQNQTGITRKMQALRSRMSSKDYSQLSLRVELQADCFAGVWAHHANQPRPFIEPKNIEETLNAANATGVEALKRSTRGTVVPDAFTHGTLAQRTQWFKIGFESGSVKACDTFSASL